MLLCRSWEVQPKQAQMQVFPAASVSAVPSPSPGQRTARHGMVVLLLLLLLVCWARYCGCEGHAGQDHA